MIRSWVNTQAVEFITICDPYFGPEHLSLIHLIRGENVEIPICILTSKMHQKTEDVQIPWDESYQAHWRLHISKSDPGEVKIVIVGNKDSGILPIQDRWMFSKKADCDWAVL